MTENKEIKESKSGKEGEKNMAENHLYKITLLTGGTLRVEIDPGMNIHSLDDFGQATPLHKPADPTRIVGTLEKTGEQVLIRWEAVAFVEQPLKVEKRAGF